MYDQWKKKIIQQLEALSLRYLETDDGCGIAIAYYDDHIIWFSFSEYGILVETILFENHTTNQISWQKCLELANLYNDSRRYPEMVMQKNGCFKTKYFLGIDKDDFLTYRNINTLIVAAVSPIRRTNYNGYILPDAITEVCNGVLSPEQAIQKMLNR